MQIRTDPLTDSADGLTAGLDRRRHQAVAGGTDQHRCGIVELLALAKRSCRRQPVIVQVGVQLGRRLRRWRRMWGGRLQVDGLRGVGATCRLTEAMVVGVLGELGATLAT